MSANLTLFQRGRKKRRSIHKKDSRQYRIEEEVQILVRELAPDVGLSSVSKSRANLGNYPVDVPESIGR